MPQEYAAGFEVLGETVDISQTGVTTLVTAKPNRIYFAAHPDTTFQGPGGIRTALVAGFTYWFNAGEQFLEFKYRDVPALIAGQWEWYEEMFAGYSVHYIEILRRDF